ncbi:MAG: alpha-galactosidase [Flavitalea sp.]
MKRIFSYLLVTVCCYHHLAAQVNIVIRSKDNAIALSTDKDTLLFISYFGAALKDAAAYTKVENEYKLTDENNSMTNNAYTPAGTWNLLEPALQVQQADGNNSIELKYISHNTKQERENVSLTTVLLKDPVYPVEVELNYRVYYNENIFEQWSVIRNKDLKKAVRLDKYASANLYFTGDKFYLRQYHGGWASEMKPEEQELTYGIKTLDSKLGTRASLFQPPSFVVGFDRPIDEDEGDVLIGTLGWTGNFRFDFEKDVFNNLRLIAGINPFASQYQLSGNTSFETPAFIYTFSKTGLGNASRNLHRWARKYRIPQGEKERMTLLNNWEATYFDFDENKLTSLFKGAKELGVDMFLLDDGWFGNKYPRNNDRAGLGDWQENRKKLPNGIPFLVKEAEKAGIKFGIWVEPEMVNPKSELYEKHRDWVIRQPDRKEYYFRNQLVLDLTNPEVQNFVFNTLDTLMTKNPTLAFLKWDCNAVIYNAHSAWLQKKKIPQGHLYVDYVKGLYAVVERFRKKYPDVQMMLCSGGGGRADYKALSYFTEYWPSDNTDAYERIHIQWESSIFFPAITSCNHVTDWGKASMKFRTDVAMMGKAGFDVVVDKLSADDKKFAIDAIRDYKSVSHTIWQGDQYRLVSPWKSNAASLAYVSEDRNKAVLFNYLTDRRYNNNPSADPVKLKGLDPSKNYKLTEINMYPGEKSVVKEGTVLSGDFLMNVGVNVNLGSRHQSVVIKFEAN